MRWDGMKMDDDGWLSAFGLKWWRGDGWAFSSFAALHCGWTAKAGKAARLQTALSVFTHMASLSCSAF